MLRVFIAVALVILMLATVSPIAWSYPTSLNLIPSADLMDPNTIRLEYENDGYSHVFGSDAENLYMSEIGITTRLEAGLDFYRSGGQTDTVLNAKYQIFGEAGDRPALSVGIMNVGEGYRPTYYLAAAKAAGQCRLHLGAIGDRRQSNVMGGIEIPLKGDSEILLDYTGGDDGYSTIGAWVPTKSGVDYSVAYGFANKSWNSDLFFVNIAYTFGSGK